MLTRLAGVMLTVVVVGCGGSKSDAEFDAMDANKDGKVNAVEHADGARRMFVAMDADKDDKVTAAEMDAAHEKVTGKAAEPSEMSAADKIKVVDSDGDGVLSASEHVTGSLAMFAKMDTDKDGALTKAELAAGHAALLQRSR